MSEIEETKIKIRKGLGEKCLLASCPSHFSLQSSDFFSGAAALFNHVQNQLIVIRFFGWQESVLMLAPTVLFMVSGITNDYRQTTLRKA
jgi:hypothetical protein